MCVSVDGSLSVRINGEHRRVPGATTLAGMINSLGFDPHRVAVERNLEIVPRANFATLCVETGSN